VITLVRANHAVAAVYGLANSTGTLLIQMFLQQQSEKFSPIGFQIGFDGIVNLL